MPMFPLPDRLHNLYHRHSPGATMEQFLRWSWSRQLPTFLRLTSPQTICHKTKGYSLQKAPTQCAMSLVAAVPRPNVEKPQD